MADPVQVRLSYYGLLIHVLPAGLVAGALGAYPTWAWGGGRALIAELAAWAVTAVVMVVSGAAVVRAACKGPLRAALAFAMAGLVRAAACLVLAGAIWIVWRPPPLPISIWLLVFYFVMLAAEVVWLARALRRAAATCRDEGR
jgi:hypothetical protein